MCGNREEAEVKQKIPGGKPPVGPPARTGRKSVAWRIVSEDGSAAVCPASVTPQAAEFPPAPSRKSPPAKTPYGVSGIAPDLGDLLQAAVWSRRSTESGRASRDASTRACAAMQMKPSELDGRLLRTIEAWPALGPEVRDKIVALIEAAIHDGRA